MTVAEFTTLITDLQACIPRYAPEFDNNSFNSWYQSFKNVSRDAFKAACMKAKDQEKGFPSIACLKGYVAGGAVDTQYRQEPEPTFLPRWEEIKAKHGSDLAEELIGSSDRERGFFQLRSRPGIFFRYCYDRPVLEMYPLEFARL